MTQGARPLLLRSAGAAGAGLESAFAGALEAGFDGIEWRLSAPAPNGEASQRVLGSDPSGRLIPRGAGRLAVAARCRSMQIDRAHEEVQTLLHECARLGASRLSLSLPPVEAAAGGPGFARYMDALHFTDKLLRRVRFDAESTGVAIAVEAPEDGWLMSPVELRGLIDKANSWAVGVCLDLPRIARIGAPADWLMTMTHRIHVVRLGPASTTKPPSQDAGPCSAASEAVAAALERIGYDHALVVPDTDRSATIRRRLHHPAAGQGPVESR